MSSWLPPPSKPRPVEDGLKVRSKRGAIAQTWWSERFIEVLESIGVGGRLARGRTYARQGQVVDFDIAAGAVSAVVQGSRTRPYRARIGLTALDKTAWNQVVSTLADNAWYTAKLLAGEMPEDIEQVFASAGLSLFPDSASDLSMDCTCPDWEVPCKHLAAVFYLLAESFDTDPFGILAWRGRDRDDLLDTLSALRAGGVPADRGEPTDAAVPLTECMASYFAVQTHVTPRGAVPTPTDAVLDQAPAVDVTLRGVALGDVLRPAYLTLAAEPPTDDSPGTD
ncbi:MAG: SWIM zinc finger family protein [Nocardioidaceae bacterium]